MVTTFPKHRRVLRFNTPPPSPISLENSTQTKTDGKFIAGMILSGMPLLLSARSEDSDETWKSQPDPFEL